MRQIINGILEIKKSKFHALFQVNPIAIASSIDPLSKGLVTPPLGVEKLSLRLKIKYSA